MDAEVPTDEATTVEREVTPEYDPIQPRRRHPPDYAPAVWVPPAGYVPPPEPRPPVPGGAWKRFQEMAASQNISAEDMEKWKLVFKDLPDY